MSFLEKARSVYEAVPPLWRDVLVALLVIGVVMSGLWVYTGQPLSQAPLVVVESGSMMHPDPPYGRIGTIDPGDLILVRDVGERPVDDVVTMYGGRSTSDAAHPGEGKRSGYGHPGDVVIYQQEFCPGSGTTPIIHRAITWVEVEQIQGRTVFSYHDATGRWRSQQNEVHLPEILLSNERGFSHSGWITKGDNPATNRPADQETDICKGMLIKPEWLIGKARGEIPWIGLLKFIIQGNNWQTADEGVCVVGNARAPCDTFTMLWVSLGIVILIPLAWDLVLRLKRRDDEGGNGGGPPHETHPAMPPSEPPPHRPSRPPLRRPPEGRGPTTRDKPRWAELAEQEADERHR